MLNYKSYRGHAVYDDEAGIFHGEVLGLRAVITFQGTTVDELEKAFRDSIDDYVDWCKERGKKPEKASSGKFNLRLPPDLYGEVAAQAARNRLSMNAYIVKKLSV